MKKNGYRARKIYDPFAGCGTTGVVANSFGISNLGVERNPFFYKIGYTKVHASQAVQYLDIIHDEFIDAISQDLEISVNVLSKSAKEYLLKLYDEQSLIQLLNLREIVKTYDDIKYYMGFTFLSKLMEYVTTAKTDGIYKVPTSTKKAISVSLI